MATITGTGRRFLFLQGPHGPFFAGLGAMLRMAGAEVLRVGFNRGDAAFWPDKARYVAFTDAPEAWPGTLAGLLEKHRITDIVLYGDTRPTHAEAVRQARGRGATVHVFEEGYLRPYWVSYERGGANGHSRLMRTAVAEMQAALADSELEQSEAPAHWGDMRNHVFYGALYHAFVLFGNARYKGFAPHRGISVAQEFRLYLRRLMLMPFLAADRLIATRAVRRGGFPYHLALLQLDHDSSFRDHSPFTRMDDFLQTVIAGFADGAPGHHHLVFKAHPLEDGRSDQRGAVRRLAARHGVSARVHYIRGGKLAALLDHARSAVTVNSTAAQQALWRGLPLKAFGEAVYNKPEFASTQPIAEFFAAPTRPDARAYRDYRHYLLETSQIAGGFYSASGRRQLLRQVVDLLLAAEDPYTQLSQGTASPRQQLRAAI
ncbi:capsule biosynthesis protein [Profundibacterium mesophilum]|uniref:Capsule polysaccharide modification protein lipB n=1 Tax=Profundibacterium mesophilum KAUST100406-0324 TaxID=1037889 RepID=A0A921NP45_9RHOB|nr:capsular biosynthesis protein [Profundibacterium mesophilum]KAF0675696.1 Capsule polysaccharide modification protein lipB [Profundibacterium mesophilum KAUST100406-0324]